MNSIINLTSGLIEVNLPVERQFLQLLNTNNTLNRGIASYEDNYNFNKLFEHTLSYNSDLTEDLKLDAVVGYSYQSFEV